MPCSCPAPVQATGGLGEARIRDGVFHRGTRATWFSCGTCCAPWCRCLADEERGGHLPTVLTISGAPLLMIVLSADKYKTEEALVRLGLPVGE